MVKPEKREASRKAGQNSPGKAIPWWFARREARRRLKVKGSSPPGLNAGLPSQVTGQRAPSCEQQKKTAVSAKRPAPWWFVKREAKRKGVKQATVKPTGHDASRRGLQKSVREVVRAVLRPLLSEFRRALKLSKPSVTREKAARPSFVSAGFMKGVKLQSPTGKVTSPTQRTKTLQPKKLSSTVALVSSSKPVSERAVYKPSGAFAFDYGTYERNQTAESQWKVLCGQLNNIAAQTVVAKAGTNSKVVLSANDMKVRNLLLMYVKECGVDAIKSRRHELNVLIGDHINPITNDVLQYGNFSSVGVKTGATYVTLDFPQSNALLRVFEDARPSEVLSLWFGENQKLALCSE